jgi:hypothetical protein
MDSAVRGQPHRHRAAPLCITRAELEEGLQAVNNALDVADRMLPNP